MYNFNTNNVEDMRNMFYICCSLNSLNLFNFNTNNVKDMNNMLEYCSSLNSLNLSKVNTNNVKNMIDMLDDLDIDCILISYFSQNLEFYYITKDLYIPNFFSLKKIKFK